MSKYSATNWICLVKDISKNDDELENGLFRSVICGPHGTLTDAFERLRQPPWQDMSLQDDVFNITQTLIPVPGEDKNNTWELLSVHDSIFAVITKCNYTTTRREMVPSQSFLEFHFSLDGETTLSAEKDDAIPVHQTHIFVCRQGKADYEVYCPPGPRRLISLYVRPEFMIKRLGVDPTALPDLAKSLFSDPSEMIIQQLPIRLDLQNTIYQLLDTPFTGMRRLHFCASKIIDLLCLCARDLAALVPSDGAGMVFNERDLAMFNNARQILSTQFLPQPTILSLSKAVGTNTNKLKTGFKILYGMTIFEFGNHHRMMHAQKLLAEKHLPVSDVARLVGYQSQASFSIAFKDFFGELPRDVRRKGAAVG